MLAAKWRSPCAQGVASLDFWDFDPEKMGFVPETGQLALAKRMHLPPNAERVAAVALLGKS